MIRVGIGFILGVAMAWVIWTRLERDISMCPPEPIPVRRQRALGIDPHYLRDYLEKEEQRNAR